MPEDKQDDYEQITEKTELDEGIIKKLLSAYLKINKLEKISADQLNIFNNSIEDFYDNCK